MIVIGVHHLFLAVHENMHDHVVCISLLANRQRLATGRAFDHGKICLSKPCSTHTSIEKEGEEEFYVTLFPLTNVSNFSVEEQLCHEAVLS